MLLDRERRAIYLTMSGSAELAIIDQKSGEVRKVDTGETPCALALNPVTATLYIVNHTGDSVTVVNAAHRIVIATVAVGHQPQGIALDAKRNRIYVANRGDSSVSVIDGGRNKVVRTVPVAGIPFALAVEPGSGRLYATTMNNPLVVAIP
jgi:YVTN family beta-propeller protein